MKFGEKLSFLRKQQDMTQQELAERLGVSRQAVSRWEQGTAKPSTENLISIGKLFHVSVDALVNESVQLQTESTVQVAVVEEKEGVEEEKELIEKPHRNGILKLVGTVILAIVAILAVCIGSGKGTQNPMPIEDLNKDAVNVSDAVIIPIEPIE